MIPAAVEHLCAATDFLCALAGTWLWRCENFWAVLVLHSTHASAAASRTQNWHLLFEDLFSEATVTVTGCSKSRLCGDACRVCDHSHKICYRRMLALSMIPCMLVAVAALLPLYHSPWPRGQHHPNALQHIAKCSSCPICCGILSQLTAWLHILQQSYCPAMSVVYQLRRFSAAASAVFPSLNAMSV